MTEPARNTSSDTAGPGAWTPIPMSRGRWFYTTGQEDYPRGVYQAANGGFEWRAPLAHVVGQIPGLRGTEGIICADPAPESPRVIVGHGLIKDGSWANMLGLPLSDDRAVMNAASSALRILISEAKLVPPAPWIGEDGQLCAPDETGCLAAGYLATSDAEPGMALDGWRAVAGLLGPEMAIVLGLAAVAPYLKAAGHRSLVCELYGDPGQGKTTTLAAALWGDPAGVMVSFNSTARGMERHLGQLGVLPGVADETGMAAFTPDEWRRFLFGVGEGDQRLTARYRDPSGTSRSARWDSVFFMSGNGQVTDGLATGVHAGLRRRVVSIPAPFTTSPEQAEALTGAGNDPGLLASCYGHLGAAIRGRYTVADVRQFYDEAAGLLGPLSNEPVARDLGKYMRLGVAGVLMVGALLGTGDGPREAAVTFARGYLAEHGHAPEHDADRFIAAVLDFAAREGSRWPTETGYSREDQRDPARGVAGVWADDRSRVWVFTATVRELCQAEGLDRVMVCRELARRGLLVVPRQTRSSEKRWQKRKKLGGGNPWVYEISGAAFGDEDQDGEATPAADPDPAPQTPPAAPERPEPRRMTWGEGPTIGDEYGAQPAPAPALAPRRAAGGRSASQARRTLGMMAPDGPGDARRRFMADTRARKVFTADAQYAALAAALGELDDGGESPRLRVLAALEGGKGDGGRERPGPFAPARSKREPYWKPELPPVVDAALPFTGWSYERDGYSGPAVVLDGSGAYVSATSSVVVAHGKLEHTGAVAELPASGLRPGYYLVTAYPWPETAMPSPLGNAEPGAEVWVPHPVAALLRDLAAEDRWPDSSAADSWTGDPCRLAEWSHFVRELRRYAVAQFGRDSAQYDAVKVAFGQALGLLQGSWADGEAVPRRVWRCKAQRPDWAQAIKAQAAAVLWRRADQCRKAAPDLGPLALRNVDELVLPEAALNVVTAAPGRGAQPPVRIDPAGIEFGTFKVKAREDWEG